MINIGSLAILCDISDVDIFGKIGRRFLGHGEKDGE